MYVIPIISSKRMKPLPPCYYLSALLFAALVHGSRAFSPISFGTLPSTRQTVVRSSVAPSNESDDERERLLEKAKKLREEAQNLERQVRESKPISSSSEGPTSISKPAAITELKDSTWTISYRFSSQPKDDDEENRVTLPNYSGKLTLLLKNDGYSELVANDDPKLQILKVWGWDEEFSQEDQKQYLLFSMDVLFPKSDPKLSGAKERYYFQARIDRSNGTTGAITLNEGTVTVKKDVAEKTKGMWGLFKVAGILSQFRYVGDFIAKPS